MEAKCNFYLEIMEDSYFDGPNSEAWVQKI
jgi:hypothetical protein